MGLVALQHRHGPNPVAARLEDPHPFLFGNRFARILQHIPHSLPAGNTIVVGRGKYQGMPDFGGSLAHLVVDAVTAGFGEDGRVGDAAGEVVAQAALADAVAKRQIGQPLTDVRLHAAILLAGDGVPLLDKDGAASREDEPVQIIDGIAVADGPDAERGRRCRTPVEGAAVTPTGGNLERLQVMGVGVDDVAEETAGDDVPVAFQPSSDEVFGTGLLKVGDVVRVILHQENVVGNS